MEEHNVELSFVVYSITAALLEVFSFFWRMEDYSVKMSFVIYNRSIAGSILIFVVDGRVQCGIVICRLYHVACNSGFAGSNLIFVEDGRVKYGTVLLIPSQPDGTVARDYRTLFSSVVLV